MSLATAPTAVPSLPPGPRFVPEVAQTLLFGAYRHRLLPALHRHYGDVYTIRLAPGHRTLVMLRDPHDIRTVFAGQPDIFHAGEGNLVLMPVMGEHSVLLVDEDQHRRVRKLLMPAFHGNALRGYQDMMVELAEAEVRRWPAGQPFAARSRMQAVTLEIILRVVFGVADPGRLAELRPLVRQVAGADTLVMFGWLYPPLLRFGPWRRYMTVLDRLDKLLYAEIAQRRRAADLAERTDVLSRLLSTGDGDDGLTDAELRDQLVTLLLAGHETTATTLAWALHELAWQPEVRRTAQRAADNDDEDYLTAVVKESLRLRPVIYEVVRRLTRPAEVGGYLLPAGTVVAPTIGVVQSDPTHYPRPEDFRPERFLDGQPPANTWIPFGGGVRRCLGAGFAQVEAVAVLREVLTRFDVRPALARPEKPRPRNITLVPSRGARIVVTRR
ncbi:MAG TPA: cytochrome P450 [Pseudonocardiaceae bacterium]|nr:cytochrome P450 [Pseudonocardiaceae bacterium]